ncbi:MAG: sulfatase-like hydrolase/transferase [Bacteroidales bacterium]|nr:sulfatase-like hydrolase/transferase [Bacteroidales bacterium]
MQFYNQQLSILFRRIALILMLYFVSRLLFIGFNYKMFLIADINEGLIVLFAGLRFDIAAIFITNSLFILASLIPFKNFYSKEYQWFLALLYIPINTLAIIANLSDIIYIRFTLKRTTLDFLDMFAEDGGLFKLLPQFILDFWYILLFGALFVYLLFFVFFRNSILQNPPSFQHSKRYFKELIIIIFIVGMTIIGIRGGLQLRPIGIMTASKYAGPTMAPALLNTPFTLIKSAGKQKLIEYNFFDNNKLDSIYSPIHKDATEEFRSLNVVVIIMESLSKEHIASLNPNIPKYKGFTPFLDSLFQHGMICTQAYANGKKSIEGIPAITAGFPTMMENPLNSSIYSSNNLSSIASLLKNKNYQTAFFHGGNNGTMGFDQFTKSIGYESYYGRNEYDNDDDFDGKWGIYDEPYFQYFGRQLGSFQQPFMATIFSLSSHHPYTIPEQHKGKFLKGKLPIQECIMYSDYALQKFFEYAQTQDWYDNTLFVITADHCSEIALESYNNDWGKYAIPIFYYMPSDSLQGKYETSTQQIDIMPSILDYLHYNQQYFALGESIFDSSSLGFSISYLNYNYQLIHGNQIIKTDFKSNYNYEKFAGGNLIKEIKPKSLDGFLKAFVQTYNNRMITNKMVK